MKATVGTDVNLTRCFDPRQGHGQLEGLRGLCDVSLLTEDPGPDQVIEGMVPDLGKENDMQQLTIHIQSSVYLLALMGVSRAIYHLNYMNDAILIAQTIKLCCCLT